MATTEPDYNRRTPHDVATVTAVCDGSGTASEHASTETVATSPLMCTAVRDIVRDGEKKMQQGLQFVCEITMSRNTLNTHLGQVS